MKYIIHLNQIGSYISRYRSVPFSEKLSAPTRGNLGRPLHVISNAVAARDGKSGTPEPHHVLPARSRGEAVTIVLHVPLCCITFMIDISHTAEEGAGPAGMLQRTTCAQLKFVCLVNSYWSFWTLGKHNLWRKKSWDMQSAIPTIVSVLDDGQSQMLFRICMLDAYVNTYLPGL
jgi:hypothetical protein